MIYTSNPWIMTFFRFTLLSTVFFVNFVSLFRLMLCNVKSDKRTNQHCVHTFTTFLILLSNLCYLLTWLPYLGLVLYDSNWSSINGLEHCLFQYLICSQIINLFLTLLAIRKIYSCFNCENAKIISIALMFAWILPQALYLVITELYSNKLVDGSNKMVLINNYFGSEYVYNSNESNNFESEQILTNGTFTICVHQLSSRTISQLSWHYVVLVIPLTTIVFLCFIGQALNKNFYSSNDKCFKINCICKDDILTSTSLYLNLIWLLILRPLIVLQTIILKQAKNNKQQVYLDFGTHFVLIYSVIFVPFSSQGGFRTKCSKKFSNRLPLIKKHCNINPTPSFQTVLAMHQQYLASTLNNLNHSTSTNQDESSGYLGFNNLENFYSY